MDPKYWSRNPGLESSKALEPKLWNVLSRGAKLGWEFQSHQNPFPGNSQPIHGAFPKGKCIHRELGMRKGHISTRGSRGDHLHPPYPKIGIVLTILLEFAEQDPFLLSQSCWEELEIPKSMPGHPMMTIIGQKCLSITCLFSRSLLQEQIPPWDQPGTSSLQSNACP